MPPLPTPTNEDIDFVREVVGEVSFQFVAGLIDNLNDAQWGRALDLVTAWNNYAPGGLMSLEGGREGVRFVDAENLEDVRRRLRLLLGLPELRDISLTGGCGSAIVPVLMTSNTDALERRT